MAKPEKFDHLHLVYHFTVPLWIDNCYRSNIPQKTTLPLPNAYFI